MVAGAAMFAVALGAGAVISPGAALAGAAGVVFVAVCFADLGLALAAFTVLIFFERFAGSTGAAKAAGLVLAAAWAVKLLAQPRQTPFLGRTRPVLAGAAVLFVFLGFASSLWAEDPGRSISGAVRLAQVVVLYLIAYSALRAPGRAELAVWAFVVGAFLAAATGLVTGEGFATTERLSGGILDPNFLAASLVAGAGMSLLLVLDPRRNGLLRLALLAFLAVDLLAVFRTESRGGIVALGAVLVLAPAVAGPLRARAIALALVVAAVGVGYYSVLASVEARERVSHFTSEGGAGRSDHWRIALDVTGDHPALGIGLGNFAVVEPAYTPGNESLQLVRQLLEVEAVVHNSYLEPLTELGPLGLAALLVAAVGPLLVGWRAVRAPEADTLLRALVVGLAALVVAYFFLSGQYEKQLWLLAGLMLGAVDAPSVRGGAVRPRAPVRPAGRASPWPA